MRIVVSNEGASAIFGYAKDESAGGACADRDKLIECDGEAFRVTDRGRPFVRAIAACFDAYFDSAAARHAPGV